MTASSPASDLLRLGCLALEHLAAQPEHDQPVRALGLEHEPALGDVPRLLELLARDGLVGDLLQLGRDRRDRVVDPLDVDAGLCEERARVGVAWLIA